MTVFNRSFAFLSTVSTLALLGCGGSTDIDFQGYDGGTTAGSGGGLSDGGTGGGTSDGGAGGAGATGGSGAFGGAGGSTGGTGGNTGGTGGTGVVCGGTACPPPSIPVGQAESCCVGDKCGISSSLIGGQCIELGQAGTPDPSCPPLSVQGFTLQGCCKPSGVCGALDTFIGLGCVDPSQFGGPPPQKCGGGTGGTSGSGGTAGTGGTSGSGGTAGTGGTAGNAGTTCGITNPDVCTSGEKCCVLDPGLDYCAAAAATCNCTNPGCNTLPVTCDGPEDCPGQICCGTFSFQQNKYTSVKCENSCGGPNKREICHPGQICMNPNQTCSQSNGLPSNLNRCN